MKFMKYTKAKKWWEYSFMNNFNDILKSPDLKTSYFFHDLAKTLLRIFPDPGPNLEN